MSGLKTFLVELERTPAIYSPGERIAGKLHVLTEENIMINKIMIELKGEAFVRWSAGKKSIMGRANYVDFMLICLDKDREQEHIVLEAGVPRVFSFEFMLPMMMPTSFESRFYKGHIRYWVQGIIDIPWSFNRYTHTTFTIINRLDLNCMPILMNSIGVDARKNYCCGPCQSRPVDVSFNVNKTGFVAGETAIFNVSINNQSSRDIKSIKLSLVQNISFLVRSEKLTFKENVLEIDVSDHRVKPSTQETFSSVKFKIPPTCSSLLDSCQFIQNHYTFELKIEANGLPSLANYLIIPVFIGTVPLLDPRVAPNLPLSYEIIIPIGAKNNDGEIQKLNFINFFFPIYPILNETPTVFQVTQSN